MKVKEFPILSPKNAYTDDTVLHTTIRACEIRGWRWQDINFKKGVIRVVKSKTESGKRFIPLNDDAWRAISELYDRTKKLCKKDPLPGWYVFPTAEGDVRVTFFIAADFAGASLQQS